MKDNRFVKVGENVSLRRITDEDTDLIVKWRNNERIRSNFVYRVQFTRQIHEEWLKTKVYTRHVIQLIICENEMHGNAVGSVYFKYLDDDKTEAEYGIFIGEDDAIGKGYGNETALLALEYAKEIGIKKVILRAFGYNMVAIKSYEHAGFVKTKDLPAVVCSDGQKSDMILMEKNL